MALVSLRDIHVRFENHSVLEGVTWEIHRGEKVGLVGANGSGKTTLFRIILGQLAPSIGTVTRSRGLQIAYLPQDPTFDSTGTLYAEVCKTFEFVRALERRVAEAAQRIAESHDDPETLPDLLAEYDELHRRLEAAGGYRYETCVNEVLGGLGFTPADYELPISALSGGQKCRAALARLLLQEADLLLLDEPTNHLDIEATGFLEKFLRNYHGTAVIVSHDRYLLDRVADKIADLDERRVTVYSCRYSEYAEAKRARETAADRAYEKQQAWIAHEREYAARVKADKSRARQVHGRRVRLERMRREGRLLEARPRVRRRMALDFAPAERSGEMVLRCEGLRKAYGSTVLFEDFSLEVYRGEKIGIVGPNGVGKTTLLKMAMGKVAPDAGEIRLFANQTIGYYDQEHADLNLAHTVIDEIQAHRTAPQEAEIRSFLARFLFRGGDVYKRIADLSGGEQSRVVLAKLVWQRPQVLILDEPTNHLDIPGKEALEEALIAFEGAILLVSHDRYFLDRVVNRLLVLAERGRYELLSGNWSTYESRLAERQAAARAAEEAAGPARPARGRGEPRRSKSGRPAAPREVAASRFADWPLQKVEDAIIEREERLASTEAQFADPNVYRDPERARALQHQAAALRAELAELNAEWEARAQQAE